jgi:hypothetical protein
MKHVTFGTKSMLIGDVAAETLLEYAALIAELGGGDTVDLHAVNGDGNAVTASFLLDSGTPLMAETTVGDLPEPDNTEAVAYMKHEIAEIHAELLRASTRPGRTAASGAEQGDEAGGAGDGVEHPSRGE